MIAMEDDHSEVSLETVPPASCDLQTMLNRLSSTKTLQLKAEDEALVAVVVLQRYLSENPAENHSYDLTVTDGFRLAKCLLDPALNHLVHINLLRSGTDVAITQCSYVYNERRVGHGYIRIEQLRCVSGTSVLLPRIKDVNSLPVLVKQGMTSTQSEVPLQMCRKHYLSLWNSDDPEGDMWISGSPSSDTVLDVSNITLLSSLESSSRTRQSLPLLVKIIHKSRLRYYGKHGHKIDFPYQAYFEVADQSGTMSLVLWNELCPEFYQKLKVGTVMYLQNYALKKRYSNRTHPRMDHHRLKMFTSDEICLNPHSPASVITVISPKRVLPQWGLPEVAYHFVTRSELEGLPNDASCDVIGLVRFVGRIERVKSKGNKGPEKYWTYRWVHVVDGTSDQPFILELYSSSQPEIFNHICPTTYLVCTQMRVCHVNGSPAYLTSSTETETFITGHHKGQPYVSDPEVKSFIQWTKTLKDSTVLERTAVGGYYCYPHPPQKCVQATAGPSAQTQLVAAADLKREMETLQYREHKRFAFQGQVVAMRYMTSPRITQLGTREVRDPPLTAGQAGVTTQSLQKNPAKRRTRDDATPGRCGGSPAKRTAKRQKEADAAPDAEDLRAVGRRPPPHEGSDVFSWESSSWEKRREGSTEHLRQGGLHPDSFHRGFTLDDKDALLRWSNLQPTRWAPEQAAGAVPPPTCPGYYQVTILGINKKIAVDAAYFPIVSTADPRAVGLLQDPHGNTALSSLSSGFLCPLHDPDSPMDGTLPEPEEILATISELEDTHVVCILDLCHLGGDEVEVVISKVYRVSEEVNKSHLRRPH